MLCCAAPARQKQRPAGSVPAADTTAVSNASASAAGVASPHRAKPGLGRQRMIQVRFPGGQGGFREVCWSEDPDQPRTMDDVKELLRQEQPDMVGTAAGGDFDLLDDDGDAILAPSTWPAGTRVIVSLDGLLSATCQSSS